VSNADGIIAEMTVSLQQIGDRYTAAGGVAHTLTDET
jgi:hypothetical protein